MSEVTTASQREEDAATAKRAEEKSSSSTDSAISVTSSTITGADLSTTSSIDGDTDKGCPVSSGAHEDASHTRAPTFRQPRYLYQHHRAQSYMRYEQQQQQQQQVSSPFGALYAQLPPPPPPPPPPGAPLAALHRPPAAYAAPALFYEPADTISVGHHLAQQPSANYCEAIGATQPATAVYTAAASANAVPMALPGQPVNLNLFDQSSLLMTQYGRPPPPIYYYTTPAHLNLTSAPAANQQQQQQQKSFTTNYGRRPPVELELELNTELAPVPSSLNQHHHHHHQQQQAMQLATSTCCCHPQQQQHELAAAPPLPAAAPPRIGSFVDGNDVRQSPDADRDNRDSRDAAEDGGGKTSLARLETRVDDDDDDLSGARPSEQNLTQDLTSPPPEQQQPPQSPGGCQEKSAPPPSPHSPPSTTASNSPPTSSSSSSHHHQPAASSRAVHMGHGQHQHQHQQTQRDQPEASRPYYRQPNGPTYYHHLLPSRSATNGPYHHQQQLHHHHQHHHHQQYCNNAALQQHQCNGLPQHQQYLVAGRHYMPPHLYGTQQVPHAQHHQLHLAPSHPDLQQQQHRQLILLPPQAPFNYPHLNYQQLASAPHQQLYGTPSAATYAAHQHHAPASMHPIEPYHHQNQAYSCQLDTMRSQPTHLMSINYHHLPTSWPQPPPPPPPAVPQPAQQIAHYAQQQQHPTLPPNQLVTSATIEVGQTLPSKYKPDVTTLLLFKQAQTWAAMLPIDFEPTKTRQAYGMDKVWRDEFEQLFSQLSSDVGWTLIEVETNPSLRNSESIVGYRGRYLIQLELDEQIQLVEAKMEGESSICNDTIDSVSDKGSDSANESTASKDNLSCKTAYKSGEVALDEPEVEAEAGVEGKGEGEEREQETESDCDSGAQVHSTSGCSSNSPLGSPALGPEPSANEPSTLSSSSGEHEIQKQQLVGSSSLSLSPPLAPVTTTATRPFSTRFRMFIDSAKVRFCCDHCGHGWTSMKGRVVFWYELFELLPKMTSSVAEDAEDKSREESSGSSQVQEEVDVDESRLVGYCAYKLFGQRCDVCKIEGRFERPMWYPEEVTKVLNNLYNKIGQVYFGFKMPTIDKQRRAGKPKTSHNSSLCQACYDGVCTDRK